MSQNRIIRFGYCSPNPGPNKKLTNKWITGVDNAIKEWDGISSIWIIQNGRYIEFSFDELCNLAKDK